MSKALLFLLAVVVIETKRTLGTLHQHTEKHLDGWWYLDKFGFGLGTNSFDIRFSVPTHLVDKLHHSPHSYVAFYLDEQWEQVLKSSSCRERLALNHTVIPVTDLSISGTYLGLTELIYESTITQSIRPHMWYVSWVNCDKEDRMSSHSSLDAQFAMTFRQADGSHVPVESQGMLQVHLFTLVAFLAGVKTYWNQFQLLRERTMIMTTTVWNDLPTFMIILTAAIFCQFFSVVSDTAGWVRFSQTGATNQILEFFGEVFDMVGHALLTSLFIAVSFGWLKIQSITSMQFRMENQNIQQTKEIAAGLLAIHTLLLVLTKTQDSVVGFSDSYHNFDTWVHKLLMLMRLCYFGVCYAGFRREKKASPIQAIRQLSSGVRRASKDPDVFFLLISVWFLCTPVAVLFSGIFAHYWRHSFITCFTLVVQSLVLAYFGAYSLGRTRKTLRHDHATNQTAIPVV